MPEFHVLGPIQVVDRGEPIDIGGPKPRTLVALLVARAGETASSDALIDALWGEPAPDAAANTLQSYVSRLRKALGSETIVSTGTGYRLDVADDAVDARRFEALVGEARAVSETDAGRSASLLDEALGLWRGHPFEDAQADGELRAEVTRLEELRLQAVEDRFEAALALGRHGAVVGDIEAQLIDHPWRERLWAQLMTALYRSGRQGEALRAFQRAQRVLGDELGIEPSAELRRLEEQILLQDPVLGAWEETTAPALHNPYKGLRAFREDDAADFYGRAALTASLLETLGGGSRFLAVVGPSGSGKSSVVRAGLVPALRKGGLPGSDGWLIVQMLPGSHPFAELEAALLRAAFDPPAGLAEQFADPDLGFLKAALRVLPDEETPLLLLIDQFEELFILVEDEEERRRFLDNVMTAVVEARGRVRVVVTMRADFYDRPLAYPDFGELFASNLVSVIPMSTEELRAALVEPAAAVGVGVDPVLATDLVTDVARHPGALPLFQYTLTELFERRTDERLTREVYGEIGGLNGALTGKAEELYTGLTDTQRRIAGQLFLRLVTVSDQAEDTRRRVPAGELTDLDADPVAMQEIINLFGTHRLLTFDRDPLSGAPTVEVAHEALLREWPRLRDWVAEHRDDLRTHVGYSAAVAEWQTAHRNPDYLLTGERLTRYEYWQRSTSLLLTGAERAYLDESITAREQALAAERDRIAAEERLRRRARSRLWAAAAAVTALIAVAGVVLWQILGSADPSGPQLEPGAAEAFQAVEAAYDAYNSGDGEAWAEAINAGRFFRATAPAPVGGSEGGGESPEGAEFARQATLAEYAATRAWDGRIEITECVSLGFGEWSIISGYDDSLPDGYRFKCEAVRTNGFHDAGGVEEAVVNEWLISEDGSVIAASESRELTDWDAFSADFSVWLLETYPDDWWNVVFIGGVPTADSVPIVRQHLPLFLEESPDWPRPPSA
jgi:DNA-binding SARP family transcriptional activator